MGNPFEDLRQAVVVRPMNSPGPQGVAGPELKIQYSNEGTSWHNNPLETDRYLRFSTDNGVSWSDAIYFNNLSETLEWVEKARQWAENPENVPVVDPGQYSALHHATRAARSEFNAEAAALDAAGSAAEAFGAAAPAWDSETVYSYNDVVSFDNGHTYRCISENISGTDHAPNIDGVDNVEEWTRITVSPDGYFEVDEDGNLMPMITPITSEIFMLDENGDITYQPDISLSPIYINDGVSSIIHVNSFKELSYLPFLPEEGLYKEGLLIHLSSFYLGGPQISSNYHYDSTCPKSEANGITKIDLEKMGSIGHTPADTDLETYFSEQGTGSGDGCLILNDQPIYYLEQAGAVGDGVADDSIPFNNLAKAVKHIEGTTISSYGYTYRLDSLVYVYNHLNIKGTLLITKNDNKVGGLRILDTLEQRYDELDIESLGEIKAMSNELSGLPIGSEYKYIVIFSSEQIPRLLGTEMIYYKKRHYAQIVTPSSLESPDIQLNIYPAPPWDMAKKYITSVRIFKLRPRLNIELDNIIIDNTEATELGSDIIILVQRDSVRLSFNNYEQMKPIYGAYRQIDMQGNGFIIDGGNLFHYNGPYLDTDSYGIHTGNTCGGLIKNLNASTNSHNIVSRHCSNLTIQNSTIHNIDEHMGSNWHIDNCIVSRIDFAGSDLTVTNSIILNKINLRSDTPIARGTLKVDNVVFKKENGRLISPPATVLQGNFDYDATFFDNVIINNCRIDNDSTIGDSVEFYALCERGTGPTNIANGWPDVKMVPPKLIMISNISVSSNATITLVSYPGGLYFKASEDIPKIIISDVYNSKNGGIIPAKLYLFDIVYGLKVDTEEDIPCLFDLEVRNTNGCNIAIDSRGMNKHKLINCENIIFNQPASQVFDRLGMYEGREDKGITEIIGGSLSRLNYDRYRYAKIAMSGVNLKEVPILNSTSYKSKIIKMVNCYSELADDIPHMNYYIDPNYFTYSYGPMHFTVSALPTNVNTGSIAFATDALKEGESSGSGTGTMVYYNGTTWVNLYNNAPVAT